MKVDVVVVGGGLAGLFVGAKLKLAGFDDFVVLEREMTGGGVAQTLFEGGFQLEPAVGSFRYPGTDLGTILDAANVEVEPVEGPGTRYVFDGSLLHEVKPGPQAIRSPIASPIEKLRFLLEPVSHGTAPGHDESLQSFLVRHFGGLGADIAWLIASGIFAGDPALLSASAVVPALKEMESNHSSLIWGAMKARKARAAPPDRSVIPTGGMSALSKSLMEFLGDRFIAGSEVLSVRPDNGDVLVNGAQEFRANSVVLACSPGATAGLVGDMDLARKLRVIELAPVVVAGFGARFEDFPIPQGFGVLVGRGRSMFTRGVTLESSYAPQRSPGGHSFVRVIAGGSGSPLLTDTADDELFERLISELSEIFGFTIEPTFARLIRHTPGIPQYRIGHQDLVRSIELSLNSLGPVYVTGWGYRGVGISHLAADATNTVARLRRDVA